MDTSIWVIVIILLIWYFSAKSKVQKGSLVEDNVNNNISEEAVLKRQASFEKKLQLTHLPDSIRRSEIYIYRNLVCAWYNELSGKNRYNDKMVSQLRNDFFDYMDSLEDSNTYNFLSLEAKEEKEEEMYRDKSDIASRKVFAIEDAFASSIGEKAVSELDHIRGLNYYSFDTTGHLAPNGFKYDAEDKLHKITS